MNKQNTLIISKKTLIFVAFTIISYCILFVLNALNINVDILGTLIYIGLIAFIAIKNKGILIKYMLFIVVFTWHIGSVLFVENNNTFLYNLQKTTYRLGAFIPLLCFYLIGFLTILVLESNRNSILLSAVENAQDLSAESFDKSKVLGLSVKSRLRVLSSIYFVLIAFMLFRLRSKGYYSMGGIDRFDYRNAVFSFLDMKLYTYIAWFLPISLRISDYGMKKRAFFFFAIYVFYLIWVGDKFGSLFNAFYFCLLTIWATKRINKQTFRRLLCLIASVLALLMIYISYQVLYERGNIYEIGIYFSRRLTGGQSDLWWGIYRIEKGGGWRIAEFSDELKAIFTQPASVFDYNFGIYKMMRITAPSAIINNYLSRGVRFAASTQASLFYYFKYTGLIFGAIILFSLVFFIVNHAIIAYKTGDIIESICYTMFLSKTITLIQMSEIDMIGNITTIVGILVLVAKKQIIKHHSSYIITPKRSMIRSHSSRW